MKNFADIMKEIASLDDDRVEEYVKNRLQELEAQTIEETIGQGYTDSYAGYIGLKTHYKASASTDKFECPDLIYDYIDPYITLVKAIKGKWSSELDVLEYIFYVINDYSPLVNDCVIDRTLTLIDRTLTYFWANRNNTSVSIKKILDEKKTMCSERSGLAQNMFKLLGIDSELMLGYIDDEPHAYNMVYIRGYGNEPMFLFDVSHFVSFNSNEKKYSLAYFYGMNKSKYNEFISGRQYQVKLSATEKYYRDKYGFGEDYKFIADESKYIFGLENNYNVINH